MRHRRRFITAFGRHGQQRFVMFVLYIQPDVIITDVQGCFNVYLQTQQLLPVDKSGLFFIYNLIRHIDTFGIVLAKDLQIKIFAGPGRRNNHVKTDVSGFYDIDVFQGLMPARIFQSVQ